jgi:hypothetical protein
VTKEGKAMGHVKVTILHQPDAGQYSCRHFTYEALRGDTDLVTAREFAFRALGEGNFRKGLLQVTFPEAGSYSFRFERMGLAGYQLIPAQEQAAAAQTV